MIAKLRTPRSRPQYDFRPATMTWTEAAAFAFRRSESWLRSNLPDDFPRPDATYGVFATEAVERWVRNRFGIVASRDNMEDAEDRMIRKVRNHGQH